MIYFKVDGFGALRALAGQFYLSQQNQRTRVSTQHRLSYYKRLGVLPGDIVAVERIRYQRTSIGGNYELYRSTTSMHIVARLVRPYTHEEIKQKRREKSMH